MVLLLLTLTKPSGGVLPKDLNVTAMLKLKSATSRALRKGDVFSRYSKSQYILMLSVRQFSDVEIITERLQKCFAAEQPPKGVAAAAQGQRALPHRLNRSPSAPDAAVRGSFCLLFARCGGAPSSPPAGSR